METAVTTQEECEAAGCQPAQLCYGTKGLFCLIVKRQCLLLKYTGELKGACMNHKYLHAINVWTKELDRLSWENFFSHEKQCFELQSIFNFISSIANLKSQWLPVTTLSGPQSSRKLVRQGRPGSSLLQRSTKEQQETRNAKNCLLQEYCPYRDLTQVWNSGQFSSCLGQAKAVTSILSQVINPHSTSPSPWTKGE